jgi:protein-S-isoprenylcysteine O-methyltransferase Ste14
MESSANTSFEDKLYRTFTWYRVPLLLVPFALLALYVHRLDAFWWGAAVAVFGQLIQTWSGAHIHKDQKLTVSGPYCHARNPMYIGRFFLILGFVMMTWNPYVIAAYVILFAVYAQLRVLREEPRLRELFAADYEHYCSEVRRWLPRLKRYSRAEPRRASWACVRENHEDIHFAALFLILAGLLVRIHQYPNLWSTLFHK